MRRAVWGILLAVPVVVLLAAGLNRNPEASSPLLGKPAPAFTLRDLSGRSVSLARLHGQPVLINFWSTSCQSCGVEQAYLREAWSRYGKTVLFLGVDYEDGAGAAEQYLHRHGIRWPTVLDPGQTTAVNFGVSGIPETFLVDRAGVVRYKFTGPILPGTATPPQLLLQDLESLKGEA